MSNSLYLHEQTLRLHPAALEIHQAQPFPLIYFLSVIRALCRTWVYRRGVNRYSAAEAASAGGFHRQYFSVTFEKLDREAGTHAN